MAAPWSVRSSLACHAARSVPSHRKPRIIPHPRPADDSSTVASQCSTAPRRARSHSTSRFDHGADPPAAQVLLPARAATLLPGRQRSLLRLR
eukprot:2515609-Prymnesium_polylepis.1